VQVTALKPATLGDFSNVSHSELPGAFIVTVLEDPFVMADRFIHELHHNRLFCLEDKCGAIFDDNLQNSITDARFYSPWRDEPRPLHGILHALYVFQPVWHFWKCVQDADDAPAQTLGFARDQLRRIPLQLQLAMTTLREHSRFTESGQGIFDGICRGAAQIIHGAGDMLPADVQAWAITNAGVLVPQKARGRSELISVRGAIRDHIERYELKWGDDYSSKAPVGLETVEI
jgi:hypothetical protein